MSPKSPLFVAVFAALSAGPSLGAGIYDAVPQGAAYPHIEIAPGRGYDWSAINLRGEEIVFEIHVWSRYSGYKEARDLMASITDRLHQQALSLSGASLVDVRFDSDDLYTDADGLTRHGISRFRAIATVAA